MQFALIQSPRDVTLTCISFHRREEFAYKKLKHKRQNKPGCWVLRQSQSHYDEFHLDVCLNEGEQVTTFTIEKTPGDRYAFRGFPNRSYSSIRDLLTKHNEATEGILNLKECIPPSENGISFSI